MEQRDRKCTTPSKCRSCGADILWTKTRTGKNMPVDAVPDMRSKDQGGGNLVLTLHGGEFGELRSESYYPPKHDAKRNRYTSHFSTCPNAAEHRSKS